MKMLIQSAGMTVVFRIKHFWGSCFCAVWALNTVHEISAAPCKAAEQSWQLGVENIISAFIQTMLKTLQDKWKTNASKSMFFNAWTTTAVCLVYTYVKTNFSTLQSSPWAAFHIWIYLPILYVTGIKYLPFPSILSFFLPSFLQSFLLMILFYTRNVCLNKMLGDAIATIANWYINVL